MGFHLSYFSHISKYLLELLDLPPSLQISNIAASSLLSRKLEAEKGNKLQIILKGNESGASNNFTTNTLHCESASKKRKGMKERSVAWGHFDKFTDDEGIKKVRCKYCQEEYIANTKNSGTSNLLSHMIKCPNNPHKVDTSQQRLAFQPKKGGQTETKGSSGSGIGREMEVETL
nr:zinc finger BED domain-containing protein RICESLEEPER 4-like isoform X2 [Nicotiana tomentosiformis]